MSTREAALSFHLALPHLQQGKRVRPIPSNTRAHRDSALARLGAGVSLLALAAMRGWLSAARPGRTRPA